MAACLKSFQIMVRYPSSSRMTDQLELPDNLTFNEEETQLLDPKYHYGNDSHHLFGGNSANTTDDVLGRVWKSISYPLVLIREAYINVRKEESGILQVLRDQPITLIRLTDILRLMKDYTDRVRNIRDSFYQKPSVESSGFPKLSLSRPKFKKGDDSIRGFPKLSLSRPKFKKGDDSIRGSKELSQQNRHILLFLKKILSILLGNDQSEVYEGHKGLGSAELMGLVEAGVKQLHAELKQEHCLLIRLIRTVYDEYANNKAVYAEGWDAYKQREKLCVEPFVKAWDSTNYFRHMEADEVIKIFLPVFHKLLQPLGANILPTYWEGLSPAPAPLLCSERAVAFPDHYNI